MGAVIPAESPVWQLQEERKGDHNGFILHHTPPGPFSWPQWLAQPLSLPFNFDSLALQSGK